MPLILDCARSGERGLLDLDGYLDEAGAAELKRKAVELIATGCNELALNLERVPGINLAGLETLARIEAMLPGAKRALTILAPVDAVRARLEGAGLGEYVEGLAPFDPSAELFGLNLLATSA